MIRAGLSQAGFKCKLARAGNVKMRNHARREVRKQNGECRIPKPEEWLARAGDSRRKAICGRIRFSMNNDRTSAVEIRHRLGGDNVEPTWSQRGGNVETAESSRGNKGRTQGEYEENTKRIPREYVSTSQATG